MRQSGLDQSVAVVHGGEIRLNPFEVTDPAPLIREADRRIEVLEKEIVTLQQYLTCCAKERFSYQQATVRMEALLRQIDALKYKRTKLIGQVKHYADWLAALSVENKTLYKGVVFRSTPTEIRWQHQYDAADKFRFRTRKEELPNLVADRDQVVMLVHNVEAGDSISLKASEVVFTPKTKLETVLEPFSAAFATAFKLATPIGGIVSAVASSVPKRIERDPASLGQPSILREREQGEEQF